MRKLAALIMLLAGLWLPTLALADESTAVPYNTTVTITGPDGVCKQVYNGNGNELAVPTYSTAEWQSFYNYPESTTTLSSCAVSCTYPWGGTQAGGTIGVATGRYYVSRTTYSNCNCSGLYCTDEYIYADCSVGGVLTCYDNNGDSGCTGTTYTSCTQNFIYSCLVNDTPILMADGSKKLVSELQAGDAVRGQTTVNRIVDVKITETTQDIYGFNGGRGFVTAGHPFLTTEGWKAIDPSLTPAEGHNVEVTQLKIGDLLIMEKGAVMTLHSINRYKGEPRSVYNPITDGDHTYYAKGFLVHNKCPSPGYVCYQ